MGAFVTGFLRWPRRLVALPFIALWLILRLARFPLNLLLWAAGLALDSLLGAPGYYWPGLRGLWSGHI